MTWQKMTWQKTAGQIFGTRNDEFYKKMSITMEGTTQCQICALKTESRCLKYVFKIALEFLL